MNTPGKHRSAFISSLSLGLEQERKEIHAMCMERNVSAFIAEEVRKDLNPACCESLQIVDALLEEVRCSGVYVCMFAGSRLGEHDHGTEVPVGDNISQVSYFELELFQAALLGKPVRLFVASDFVPGPRLAAVLKILEASFPRQLWERRIDRRALAKAVVSYVAQDCRLQKASPELPSIFVEELYRHRGRKVLGKVPEFRFLNGERHSGFGVTNSQLIQALLHEVHASSNVEHKMGRLWMIVRELMRAPPDQENLDSLKIWNEVLGLWTKSGSWYRLHGHMYLGSLASSVEQCRVRQQLRELGRRCTDTDLSYPGVALGSCLYSIAKRVRDRQARREVFAEAAKELQISLLENPDNDAALAVLGSIYLQTRRLSEAVNTYAAVVRVRKHADNKAALGESLAEYGFGLVLQGRIRRGRSYLIEGVKLLANGSPGFLVRAKKKLARAHLLNGDLLNWRVENEEARALAESHNLLDQL